MRLWAFYKARIDLFNEQHKKLLIQETVLSGYFLQILLNVLISWTTLLMSINSVFFGYAAFLPSDHKQCASAPLCRHGNKSTVATHREKNLGLTLFTVIVMSMTLLHSRLSQETLLVC